LKALKVLGWIFVPYVMIFVSWKRIALVGKIFGIIWAIIGGLMAIGTIFGEEPAKQVTAPAEVVASTSPKTYDAAKEAKAKAAADTKAQKEADAKSKAEAKAKAAAHEAVVAEFKKKLMDNGVEEKFAIEEANKYATGKENGTTTDKQINDQMYIAIQEAKGRTAVAEYNEWRDSQFSAWDGSISALVKSVKNQMNDPDSFKHVETTYQDMDNLKGFKARMVFRGTNAFGGVITNAANATFDYETKRFTWNWEK
jgi:hypothetical protein